MGSEILMNTNKSSKLITNNNVKAKSLYLIAIQNLIKLNDTSP